MQKESILDRVQMKASRHGRKQTKWNHDTEEWMCLTRWSERILYLQHLLGKVHLKYVRAFFWELELAEYRLKVTIDETLRISMATVDDLENSLMQKKVASERLSDGDLCFIATSNGVIAAYLWANLKGKAYIPEFEREVVFDDSEAYMYDGFTLPDFRKRRAMTKIIEEMIRFFISQNKTKACAITLVNNEPPQKVLAGLGFHVAKTLIFTEIFGFKKFTEHVIETSTSTYAKC